MFNKADEYLVKYIEKLIEGANAATPQLSKRGINYDHKDIIELMSDACLHRVLSEILHELRFQNQEERLKRFPMSLLNPNTINGSETQNKGE